MGVGHDNVHSLVLKHSCDNFIDNIVLFLNTIFIHNFIPLDVLKGDIIPILKDKKGNISDSGNYRPIMQSSCLLKIIEIFILDFLSEKINFNSRQFGFLSKTSTSITQKTKVMFTLFLPIFQKLLIGLIISN